VQLVEPLQATRPRFAGSIPNGAFEIFNSLDLSARTMALGSDQPLREMRTWNSSFGDKGGRSVGLANLTFSYADFREIWERHLLEP
jgi:hypothetical protein